MASPYSKIVQFCAMQLYGVGAGEDAYPTYCKYVDPGVHVPSSSTRCHNITNADVHAKGQPWPVVWAGFLQWLDGLERAIRTGRKRKRDFNFFLIAHNAPFDKSFLYHECTLNGITFPENRLRFIDTLPFFKKHFPERKAAHPSTTPFNLGNLYRFVFNEDMPNAHDAKGDVEGLIKLVKHVDKSFGQEAFHHMECFIDDRRRLVEMKYIGKYRAMKIEKRLQEAHFKPGGQSRVGDLRQYAKRLTLEQLEAFLRYDINMKDDGDTLSVMSQVLRRPIWEMHDFPYTNSLRGALRVDSKDLRCITDLAGLYFYDFEEDAQKMRTFLTGRMGESSIKGFFTKYINAK
jgi:DNA polymerase III epsilon subunit-like protein